MTMTKENTSTGIERRGKFKKEVTTEAGGSSLVPSSIPQDVTNCLYLSSRFIVVGNESRLFTEAHFYRDGVMRDVSMSHKPDPKKDDHQRELAALVHYAKLFNRVDCIYFTSDQIGYIGIVEGIPVVKLQPHENPVTEALKEKIGTVVNQIRNNRGF